MDVPLGLWLGTFVGVVVVGALVAGEAVRAGAPGVGAAIGAWFVAGALLAWAGAFATDEGTWVPVIGLGIAGPIVVGAWLLRRPGPVAALAERLPLGWVIRVQLFRVVGAVFLVAWALDLMPAAFALPAGVGDVAVGLAAPFAARRLERDPVGGRRTAVLWNVAGITDLVVAVTLGFLTAPSHLQQLAQSDANYAITRMPFVLIPVFGVPLAILLHVVVLRRLAASAEVVPTLA